MNYLLHISFSCWLAITATAVIAAGSLDNQGAISDEPSATILALPSVHFTVRAPAETSHQPVLIEGFWPLMQEEQLLLLQGTWQRQQQQQHHLLSVGLGWRYFPETDWGVGYHLFYDQETTRQQRRLGLGAEVWLHSLMLTVNGYLPANGWRAARDLKGYQRCPASGYDVTLQGHLPALPHLGASLHYARYSGDAVTLGSEQQHYRNPQQWRWGIDLTPMPLLTLAYHRHATPSARAKQQISVTLTYRFSLTLLQQVDPNQVAALYSALGQRLAPVQREQWIALKYAALSRDKALTSEEAASRTEQIARAEEPARDEEPVRLEEIRLEIHERKKTNPEIGIGLEKSSGEKAKHRCKRKNNPMGNWQKAMMQALVLEEQSIQEEKDKLTVARLQENRLNHIAQSKESAAQFKKRIKEYTEEKAKLNATKLKKNVLKNKENIEGKKFGEGYQNRNW